MLSFPKVIIIGGNHVNTLGLIRSVGKCGISPDVLLEPCDDRFCTLRFSRYIGKLVKLSDLDHLCDYLLSKYQSFEEKPIILCGSDSGISKLDEDYNRLKEYFHIFNIKNTQGLVNKYIDKSHTFPIAERCGLVTIRSWHVKGVNGIPEGIEYPCLVKGNMSITSSKADMAVCRNEEELHAALKPGIDYLIQDYIEKEAEFCISGISLNHGSDTYLTGAVRKIRENRIQSEFISLEPISSIPEREQQAIKKLLAEIGYEGLFSVELMQKESIFYFLEINLRNDGTSFIYSKAGSNFAMAWVYYCMGLRDSTQSTLGQVVKSRYLMQFEDIFNVIKGKVSFFKWIRDVFKTDTHFTFDLLDPMPFIYQIYIPFRQLGLKIIK